ncbi:MAG: MFS transporter [Chloroflexota bacterium]
MTTERTNARVSGLQLWLVNAYWPGLAFMWNSLHLILLPAILLEFVDDARKNTALGLLTFIGLVIAMVVQPGSGALSDAWVTRFGRRRPLILIGTAFDLIFLALIGTATNLSMLALGYIGLQFTSNLAHGPAQGLMHDRVPPEQMGLASGVKSFLDMAGLVVSSLAVGRLLSPENPEPLGVVALVAGILLLGALLVIAGVRESVPEAGTAGGGWPARMRAAFRIDWQANAAYWRLIGSRMLFLLGIYGIQAFAQYYVRDTLETDNPVKLTGDLLATIVLTLIVFSIVAGYLCDRFGRRPLHAVAAVLTAVGSLLMLAAHTPAMVLAFGSVIGAGIGVFVTANWALANDLAPSGEAGKFLGLTNLATAGAGAISRLTGPGLDWLNAIRPGQNLGYAALFIGGAILSLASLLALRRVPEGLARPASA